MLNLFMSTIMLSTKSKLKKLKKMARYMLLSMMKLKEEMRRKKEHLNNT